MKVNKSLAKFIEQARQSGSWWSEKAKLEFAYALEKRRKNLQLSYKDLAEKINSSPAYITKVFRGDSNLTIESMVKLARSTGGKLQINIIDEVARTIDEAPSSFQWVNNSSPKNNKPRLIVIGSTTHAYIQNPNGSSNDTELEKVAA